MTMINGFVMLTTNSWRGKCYYTNSNYFINTFIEGIDMENYDNDAANGFFAIIGIIAWVSFLIWSLGQYGFFVGIIVAAVFGTIVSGAVVLVIFIILNIISMPFRRRL